MPEMDGYQATAKLRSDARFATLPIIAMTAHATIEERQRCLAAGMNDHIAKPIDPGNLFETVGRFYKPERPSRRPIGAGSAAPAPAGGCRRPAVDRRPRHEGRAVARRRQSQALSEAASPVHRAARPGGRADHRGAGHRRHRARRAARAHAQGRGRQHRRNAGAIRCRRVGEVDSRPGRRRRTWMPPAQQVAARR